MFEFLGLKEQLTKERQRNKALQEYCEDLANAMVELAEIVAREDEPNG